MKNAEAALFTMSSLWLISEIYFYCVTTFAMPPKADYWKYFNVVGVVAYCLIAECKQPNVLG